MGQNAPFVVTLNPPHSTLHTQPSTLNTQHSTLNAQLSTLHTALADRSRLAEIRTLNPQLQQHHNHNLRCQYAQEHCERIHGRVGNRRVVVLAALRGGVCQCRWVGG